MRSTILLLMLLALPAAAQTAQDKRWVLIGKTKIENVFIDAKTVERDRGLFRVWIRTRAVYDNELHEVSQAEYHCTERRMRTVAFIEYYTFTPTTAGVPRRSKVQKPEMVEEPDAEWEKIAPGTGAEAVLDAVCKYVASAKDDL